MPTLFSLFRNIKEFCLKAICGFSFEGLKQACSESEVISHSDESTTKKLQSIVKAQYIYLDNKLLVDVVYFVDPVQTSHLGRATCTLHLISAPAQQTMTEAEHNRPNPKLFVNRPSASAAELFCETIRPIVSQNIVKKILRIVSFLWLLS